MKSRKSTRNKKTLAILKKVHAVIADSHIVLTSGRHSDFYINKDMIYAYPDEVSKICKMMAEQFAHKKIDVVVGPAMGGVLLSQWTAYHLSKLKKKLIYSVFTDKSENKEQLFKRGYDAFVKGKNVLVVEDLTTTGGSVRKSVDAVKRAGGHVVAVSIIGNRNKKRVTSRVVGAPLYALVDFETVDYAENECLFCREKRPINTTVGHGKEFLENKKR